MERVGTLINKLKEQFDQHASAEQLAVTARLILAELQQMPVVTTKGAVSVVLPAVHAAVAETEIPASPVPGNWLPAGIAPEIPTLLHQTPLPEPDMTPTAKKTEEYNTRLAHTAESLNEKLREERVEVATALQEAPVRDLKKAIGINDRFLFVNELFRGDEMMYERSIKTINSFNIYAEAEYWIQRELKVKLSWSEQSEAAGLFLQLIRRRFAAM
jgi:hypothetical protein